MESQQKDRAALVTTNSGIKRLVKLFNYKCGISQRKIARNMKCTPPLVNWAKRTGTIISTRATLN